MADALDSPARPRASLGESVSAPGRVTIPSWLLILAAVMTAGLLGRFLADGHMKYGLGIMLALVYAPLVLFNFPLALGIWVAVLFFAKLSALSYGPNAMSVLVALGWLGVVLGRQRLPALLREQRRVLVTILLACGWITVSTAWAANSSDAGTESSYWWMGALAFLIVLTVARRPEHVRLILLAFLVGAVVAVAIGIATGGLHAGSASSQTAVEGRLTGGGGDPNEQAAGFVAALFLTIGLLNVYRGRVARNALIAVFVVIAVGFFATESRGGLIGLAVAALVALLLAPRQRRQIVRLGAIVAVAVGILLLVNPLSVARITNLSGGTSGRSDLWHVGWQVFRDAPAIGVGIGNFVVAESQSRFVLAPGSLSRVQYIVETPQIVHNTYLQLLAETGVFGLLGFVAVAWLCLHAGILASRRFDQLGRPDYGNLTRAVLMGTVGMLTALFFISDGTDLRLWVLLALGPVLLGIATRVVPASESC